MLRLLLDKARFAGSILHRNSRTRWFIAARLIIFRIPRSVVEVINSNGCVDWMLF